MSKGWIVSPGFIWGKVRKLEGKNLDSVENPTDYGAVSHSMRKNYVVGSCGKHPREDIVELGVRSMVGKVNLQNLEKILSWLNDDKINKIGVFGMGGCGKTTLAIHVYNRLLQSGLARNLVWVTVGVGFDIHKLQRCISSAVGLDLDYEKDETRRAARLHNHLTKRGGGYVLIIDSLWDPFSYDKVGIPCSGACKVIITTRILSVCRRIGCQRTVKIDTLEACEAWQLFCSVLGHDADDMGNVAQLVCQECGGLPLAVVHLARNLRGVNNVSEWNYTLHRLRGISNEDDFLITKHIYFKLYSSYARLANAKIKLSFLYCSLYSNNRKTQKEELIRLWIAVGLIDEVSTLRAQYDKGHTIVNNLVDSSLLESSKDGLFVKMHGMVRNMAIQITRKEIRTRFLVRCGSPLKDLVEALEFKEDYIAISLVMNCITELSLGTSPKCPKLSVLLLQHNPLDDVQDSFFLHMPNLQVLDLSSTSIQKVPDSVSDLKSLRSLILHYCQKLTYVPSLANLNALRILDLGYTAITSIPCGIEKLTMLRELNLSRIYRLKELDCGLLAMLPALKHLSCHAAGILHELHTLKSLEILDAIFHNTSDYKNYVKSEHWQSLESFHLHVRSSEEQEQLSNKVFAHYSKVVSFYGRSLSGQRLPDNLNELYIDKCEGFGSLCDLLSWDEGPNSEDNYSSVNVQHANFLGYKKEYENSTYWENLSLKHLSDKDIKGGVLLPSLVICSISRCRDIEKLFTPVVIMGLQNLEILEIRECFELRELIAEEDGDRSSLASTVRLPNLRKLELTQLPVLSSLYKGQLICTSLQSLLVDDCPKLTQLPFSVFLDDQHKTLLPMLERIEGQDEWWDSLELYQTDAKLSLQPLFRPKTSAYSASESGRNQNPIAGCLKGVHG